MRAHAPPPANDNAGAPAVIPVFACLLQRHDLTRTDVLVYGAVVAFEGRPAPGLAALAAMLSAHTITVTQSLCRLRKAGLIAPSHDRARRGQRARYVALGPRCAA